MRKAINSLDVEVSELGEIVVSSGLVGLAKPDILKWNSGSDAYIPADSGQITAKRRKALIYNNGCTALVSVCDEAGEERPYLIPAFFTREIVFPFEIDVGSAITAKNLDAGRDFDLAAEFC